MGRASTVELAEKPGTDTDEEPKHLFPELDNDNPKHKALVRAAKAFNRAKAERAETLSTMKEKQDAAESKFIALMHECKLVKFKHGKVSGEIFPSGEKAQVKIEQEEEDDDQGDDE